MAKYDFYRKRGNLNYRERSMLEDIAKRIESNPSLAKDITPANNIEELKVLHSQITSDVAEVIEEVANDDIPKPQPKPESKPFIDPLNRDAPIINEYVTEDKFDPFADFQKSQKTRNTFDEPQNYQQAFDLPDEEEMRNANNPQPTRQKSTSDDSGSPVNRRKAKRFATSIVNITCRLVEVGFIWYATKDINEAKLAEYELNGEMDLSLVLELPNGGEATIREFFLAQIPDIEQASRINKESKEDLIEALTELFVEKNIQPSASYDVAISAVSIIAEQGIKLAMIVQQNNAILNQLRQRAQDNPPPRQFSAPTPEPTYTQPTPEPSPYPSQEEISAKQKKQMRKDMKESDKMKDEFFSIAPTQASVEKAQDSILLEDYDLDDEMKNDLDLLDEFETKE